MLSLPLARQGQPERFRTAKPLRLLPGFLHLLLPEEDLNQVRAPTPPELEAPAPLTSGRPLGEIPQRTEGFLPAPESAHAIKATVEEALKARESGEKKVILFGLSGHGHFDMAAYDAYFAGKLEDVELSQSRIDAAIEQLPRVPALS